MRTETAILLFVTACLLSALYWGVIHPVALRYVRFRLFARRDKLRRLAMDRKEDHRSFAYRDLEEFICKTISVVPSMSLASFIIFAICNRDAIAPNDAQFCDEASPQLMGLQRKAVKDALLIMMFNSPLLVMLSAVVVVVLWLAGCFNKYVLYRQTESFVDDLPQASPVDAGIAVPA